MAALDLAAFRAAYRTFLTPGRVLLTGHSHQAWPDAAREAQLAYVDDAARYVDDKWERAIAPRVQRTGERVLGRLGFPEGDAIAFGKSTHELVFRLLSCLKWSERPRVVTTTSEFHSTHRQLARLAEEGVAVEWVDARDRETLGERLLAAITPGTALVAVSAVFFEDAALLGGLGAVVQRAAEVGAIPLVDAYHAFNVAPIDLGPAAAHAFVTAGGYKYAQFGEGVCFLRFPRETPLRPVYTGWFADFDALARPRGEGPVGYGPGGDRFAGATYDASGIYRAAAALDHFDRFGLDVPALRAISLRQTSHLIEALAREQIIDTVGAPLALVTPREPERRGGFLSLRTRRAGSLVAALRERNVFADARGELLRLGPAPYLSDEELERGVALLGEAVRG